MGLDVYLYKYENKPETDRLEKEYETISDKNWNDVGKYESLSQIEKDVVRKKNEDAAFTLGLGEYGEDNKNKTKIEFDSSIDKEHYFKIGYFRSSYNGSGINHVLRNLNVPDLQDIFNPQDEYCFQPDWEDALQKCTDAISELKKKGNYVCFSVSPNLFRQPECMSEKEAIEILTKEISAGKSVMGNYSNAAGYFYYEEPLKILALVHGIESFRKQPCVYVVCEGNNERYIKALEIVKETIEYVLRQPDIEKYFLHWSS